MNNLGIVSMFSGPGGFDVGFAQAGFATRLAYDKDPVCVETHQANFPGARATIADLSRTKAEDVIHDWNERSSLPPVGVIGGSPCQSFSISNVHQNEDDLRHELPGHFARLLQGLHREFDLDFFVFENVPGLAASKHVHRLDSLKLRLKRSGFNIFSGILDAQHFGVPQVRSRVFVVGINRGRFPDVQFRFPTGKARIARSVGDVLRDLPEPIWTEPGNRNPHVPFHPNHRCMRPKSSRFTDGSLQPGKQPGRSFRVLSWDRPSYTVAYGNREVHVHPNGHRRLSVYEAMLLQGFPRSYVLSGTLSDQIRLVSEAVCPPVARALAQALRDQLNLE